MIPWLEPLGNADDIEAADGQQPTAVWINTTVGESWRIVEGLGS